MPHQRKNNYCQFKPLYPVLKQLLAEFLQKFQAKFNAQTLLEQVVPLYDKYLSAEDIQGLVQFYESPLGQRMIKALPQISQESQTIGFQLGKQTAQDVLREMQDEYPELKQAEKPSGNNP